MGNGEWGMGNGEWGMGNGMGEWMGEWNGGMEWGNGGDIKKMTKNNTKTKTKNNSYKLLHQTKEVSLFLILTLWLFVGEVISFLFFSFLLLIINNTDK
jgi:hypothetical protein